MNWVPMIGRDSQNSAPAIFPFSRSILFSLVFSSKWSPFYTQLLIVHQRINHNNLSFFFAERRLYRKGEFTEKLVKPNIAKMLYLPLN